MYNIINNYIIKNHKMNPSSSPRWSGRLIWIWWERPLSWMKPSITPGMKVKDILDWKRIDTKDYVEFENRISNYRKEILEKAYRKTGIKWHRAWYKEHIEMLQSIYMKLFPGYKETLSWYCLIQAKPDSYNIIKYYDFPWEYSLENFLNKFDAELDALPDCK